MARIPEELIENAAAPPKPKLNPDLNAVCACASFGNYPWDDWHRYALARGLEAGLAGLGRLLIRAAFNHGWEPWLQSVCGWSDDGQALLALALRSPEAARQQWEVLFRTDGLRGDYPPSCCSGAARGPEWTCGFLRADAKRLAARLYQQSILLYLSIFSATFNSLPCQSEAAAGQPNERNHGSNPGRSD